MNASIKTRIPESLLISASEKLAGKFWSLLYPRIYNYAPNGYCSPKLPAAMFLEGFLGTEHNKHPFDRPTALKLAKYSMPTLWLGKALAESIRNTVPPNEYDLLDLELPLPAMTILLPKGSIVSRDAETRFISFARYEAGEIADPKHGPHLFVVSGAEDGTLQALSLSRNSSKFSVANADKFIDKLNRPGTLWEDETGDGTDDERNKLVVFYFLSTMLIMNSRPELVTHPQLLNRVHQKHKEPREFWSPYILGHSYTVQRETPPEGSHQSPRLHWVRGFYRNQAFGSRAEPQHKLIWIEPFLRGE